MTRILSPVQQSVGRCKRLVLTASFALSITLLALPLFAQNDKGTDKQATALYSEAAGLQNASEFELAVELWDEFVEKYPEHERIMKARHYQGVCHLQLKNLDKARAAFEQVVEGLAKEPDFPLAEDALLNLGWSQFSLAQSDAKQKQLFDQAAKNFRNQVKKFPAGKLADQGWYFLGESLYLGGKLNESLDPYRKVVNEFADSDIRANAMYALGVALQEANKAKEAREIFEQFTKDYSDNPLVDEIRLRSAETLLQEATDARDGGDKDKAIKLFAEAEKVFAELASNGEFERADHARYQQAFCLLGMEKYGESAQAYAVLAENFPESNYAKSSKLSAGKFFYKAENDDAAQRWLTATLEDKVDESSATEAAHWLCRLLIKKKQFDEAAKSAQDQLASADGPFLIDLEMDLADAIYEKGDDRHESLELYKKIVADHPNSKQAAQALYNAAYTALDLKMYDAGMELTKQFESKFPKDSLLPDARYVNAECLMMTEKFDQAESIYDELVKNRDHPDLQSWQVRHAMSRFMQKKYQKTIELLLDHADGMGNDELKGQAQYLVGASSFYTDKFDDAANWLEKRLNTLANAKNNDDVLLLLARSKMQQDKPDEALRLMERFQVKYAESPLANQANYYHAQMQSAKGNHPQAATLYQQVVDADESDFTPYAIFGKGLSLQKSNKPREAEAAFSELLDKYPEHALRKDALLGRGTARRSNGDFQQAMADLEEMMSDLEGDGKRDAFYELGLAQIGMKKYAEAINSFQQVYDADAASELADDALYQLAWAYKYSADLPKATGRFEQLMSKHADSPFAPEAAFHVGELAYQDDKLEAAAEAYRFSKEKSKDDDIREKASFKLAWCFFKQEQYDPAAAEFMDLVSKHPSGNLVGDATFMVGESYFKKDNYGAAIQEFKKALPLVADSTKTSESIKLLTRLHGAKSANETKQFHETLKFLDPIEEHFGDSNYLADAWLEKGRYYRGKNQRGEAIAAFEKAAIESLGPTGAQARCLIGEVLFAEKKHEDAIKAYKRVMYGYGGARAPDETRKWQALSGYEAGRCAQVLAGQEGDASMKKKHIKEAITLFQYVVEKHADNDLAAESKKELDKLGK